MRLRAITSTLALALHPSGNDDPPGGRTRRRVVGWCSQPQRMPRDCSVLYKRGSRLFGDLTQAQSHDQLDGVAGKGRRRAC